MIPNATRQETATTTTMTMAAMAPEDRCEDDLDAWGIADGLDPGKNDLEALGLVDGLDTIEIEDVVASAPDQRMDSRLWGMGGIPLDGIMDEVLEMLLGAVGCRLLVDVDEDSTALASAIETFAFALAKLVQQTLI